MKNFSIERGFLDGRCRKPLGCPCWFLGPGSRELLRSGSTAAEDGALSVVPDGRRLYALCLHCRVVSFCDVNAGGGNNPYQREYRGEYENRDTIHWTLPVSVGTRR